MARLKNAIRGHFVAEYIDGQDTVPADSEFKELAKWIATIEDDSDEETDDTAFYDGDGTPETTVVSVASGWSVEGFYDSQDEAQELIATKRYLTGSGRKVWHKIVSADATKQWVGRATCTDIVAGGGDASDYEAFSCTIRFDSLPKEAPASGVGVPPNINGSTDVYPTAITIAAVSVAPTKTAPLVLTFTPTGTTKKGGQYVSLDKAIATVDKSGVVTGVKSGSTEVLFVSEVAGIVGKATVTVTP